MRSLEDFETVRGLAASGMNDCAIARETGIPRRTVRDLRLPANDPARLSAAEINVRNRSRLPLRCPRAAYGYLLGIYLGDGCISRGSRVWRLRITLDSRYPGYHRTHSRGDRSPYAGPACGGLATFRQLHGSLSVLETLAVSVPQHGPGKKHLRPIRLEPWQEVLVKEATEDFIRGLIESDGCRVVANDRGVQKRPLPLLKPIRRNPWAVLRGAR